MQLLDISVPIRSGMFVYPRNPGVHIERVSSIPRGDVANLSRLDFGVHSGTHVDAPLHFIDGAPGAEALPLDALMGPCHVVDATGLEGDIDQPEIPAGAERVLFKTRNSELWDRNTFSEDFVRLTVDAARGLVGRGVRLVGVDYLSVGGPDTHRALLGAGVVILEGLDLREVEPGRYRLLCLPLLIPGSDGAPARALLVRD